jgi:hypothetical protein
MPVPSPAPDWWATAATHDPDGADDRMVLVGRRGLAGSADDLAITSCTAATCDDNDTVAGATTLIPGTSEGARRRPMAVDAVPGAIAVAGVRWDADGKHTSTFLARCSDAQCADLAEISLGPVPFDPFLDMRLAKDGTAYVLLADSGGNGSVSLLRVRPGSTTPEVLHTESVEADKYGFFWADGSETGGYFDLSLGPDGVPVIVYRDMPSGRLRVVRCNDADCSSPRSGEVDIPVEGAYDPAVAIDSTGSLLIATHEKYGGIVVHVCADDLCSKVTGVMVTDGSPPYAETRPFNDDPVSYLYVDSQDRPVVLADDTSDKLFRGTQDKHGDETSYAIIRCLEVRCGA